MSRRRPDPNRVRSLRQLLGQLGHGFAVRRTALEPGLELTVRTRNSTYRISPLGGDRYQVHGGWFDRATPDEATVTIVGCTWGGHAVCVDLLAAPGLFLEFGNSVRTTRIQQVVVAPKDPELHAN